LAILAEIGPAFEHLLPEYHHFLLHGATENGGASCREGIAELISARY
jgi:hypothetical protein